MILVMLNCGSLHMQATRNSFIVFSTIIVSILISAQCYAKRMMPESPPPVIYNHTTYSPVVYNGLIDKTISSGAYIEAYDNKTKKLLWRKQIYKISYNPGLESDVQDVYITKVRMQHGNLIINNEKGYVYELNTKTHEVKLIAKPPMKH